MQWLLLSPTKRNPLDATNALGELKAQSNKESSLCPLTPAKSSNFSSLKILFAKSMTVKKATLHSVYTVSNMISFVQFPNALNFGIRLKEWEECQTTDPPHTLIFTVSNQECPNSMRIIELCFLKIVLCYLIEL